MEPTAVVRAWFDALNALDIERLVELAGPDVRLQTPRGPLQGHDGVREFARRQSYGVRMHVTNLRLAQDGDAVITEDAIEFRSVDDGSTMGREVMRARWVVRDGRLTEFAPYEGDLPE